MRACQAAGFTPRVTSVAREQSAIRARDARPPATLTPRLLAGAFDGVALAKLEESPLRDVYALLLDAGRHPPGENMVLDALRAELSHEVPVTDVLIVSLSGTGWAAQADDAARRVGCGARARRSVSRAAPVREWTFAAIELAWALSARRAAAGGVALGAALRRLHFEHHRGPARPPAGRDPLRRPRRRQPPRPSRRLAAAGRAAPASAAGRCCCRGRPAGWPTRGADGDAIVVPVPVEPSAGRPRRDDIAAITYGADPSKKGLDRVLAAWRSAAPRRRGAARRGPLRRRRAGVRVPSAGSRGGVPGAAPARARLRDRAARVDHGIAQLEALADGCLLVTNAAPGRTRRCHSPRELHPLLSRRAPHRGRAQRPGPRLCAARPGPAGAVLARRGRRRRAGCRAASAVALTVVWAGAGGAVPPQMPRRPGW